MQNVNLRNVESEADALQAWLQGVKSTSSRRCLGMVGLLLALVMVLWVQAVSAADAWYVMRNQGVKVGWMRLGTERSAKGVALRDEVFFDTQGQQGRFVHRMTARNDAHLTPSHFALDVVRSRKPWTLEADIAGGMLTPRRQLGMPAIKGAVKIAPEFATEFSAMRLAAATGKGATRKVALLGAWEKPLIVLGELRYEREERLEIGTRFAVRHILGGPFFGACANVAQNGDVIGFGGICQFGSQLIDVVRGDGLGDKRRPRKQPLIVQRLQQRPTVGEGAQAVEPHGIQPLKNVAVFPVLRQVPVLLDKALDFFEARNDAFLTGRPPHRLFDRRELGELVGEFVQIRAVHSDHPP